MQLWVMGLDRLETHHVRRTMPLQVSKNPELSTPWIEEENANVTHTSWAFVGGQKTTGNYLHREIEMKFLDHGSSDETES